MLLPITLVRNNAMKFKKGGLVFVKKEKDLLMSGSLRGKEERILMRTWQEEEVPELRLSARKQVFSQRRENFRTGVFIY